MDHDWEKCKDCNSFKALLRGPSINGAIKSHCKRCGIIAYTIPMLPGWITHDNLISCVIKRPEHSKIEYKTKYGSDVLIKIPCYTEDEWLCRDIIT